VDNNSKGGEAFGKTERRAADLRCQISGSGRVDAYDRPPGGACIEKVGEKYFTLFIITIYCIYIYIFLVKKMYSFYPKGK
jgi:hypothetical protein